MGTWQSDLFRLTSTTYGTTTLKQKYDVSLLKSTLTISRDKLIPLLSFVCPNGPNGDAGYYINIVPIIIAEWNMEQPRYRLKGYL